MFKNIKISTVFGFGSTLASIAVSLSPVQSMEQEGNDLEAIQPSSTLNFATTSSPQSSRPWHNQKTSNNTTEIRKEQIRAAKQSGKKEDGLGAIQPSSILSLARRSSLQSPRPWHNQSTLKNTPHAELRKEQRGISNQHIQTAKQSGKKEEHKNSITYTNETTKVVSGKNDRVITVIDNKRNTNFDLLQIRKNS